MTIVSLGDLAQSIQLRRDNGRISAELNRLAQELSSGQVKNLPVRLGGDFGSLTSIERDISRVSSFQVVVSEAGLEAAARQGALESIRSLGAESAQALILVNPDSDSTLVNNALRSADGRFESVLGLLNTQVADRSLFAGIAVSGPAIADKETILASLDADIASAGAVSVSGIVSVVDAWFGAGGDFETVGYLGDTNPLSGLRLTDTKTLRPAPTADDMRLREFVSAFAIAALAERNTFGFDASQRAELARLSGDRLLSADRSIVDLQAFVGEMEARLSRAEAELAAQFSGLELARSELLSVDPFDTATQLQSVETQLRTFYSVTARLSQLSLSNFL